MHPTVIANAFCYDGRKGGGVDGNLHAAAVTPFHVWGSLIEKAGFKVADDPENAGRVYRLLRAGGAEKPRNRIPGVAGFNVSTIGNVSMPLAQFLIAWRRWSSPRRTASSIPASRTSRTRSTRCSIG